MSHEWRDGIITHLDFVKGIGVRPEIIVGDGVPLEKHHCAGVFCSSRYAGQLCSRKFTVVFCSRRYVGVLVVR